MKRILARNLVASLVLVPAMSSAALALDPGNYTVQCASQDSARVDGATYDISMDMVDLLTLKNSFGTIISGVRLDDGKRVILTGDRGCALIQTRAKSSSR
jgi:hypothetical protein